MSDNSSIIESILFASGEPVSIDVITNLLGMNKEDAREALEKLDEEYKKSNRGIMLRKVQDCYLLCTKPDNYEYVQRSVQPRRQQDLSKAAYETLAIIAYNQPTTKARIDSIRGVSSDKAIQTLLDKELICEAGRMDVIGRPIVYEVTDEFLKDFGLDSLDELPVLEVMEKEDGDVDIDMILISDKEK
ncbi:MAG: SMC-Scp complex subunit ScpB [Clostridiales bacterium]|nr:SMC-Scp complex subunit ScpB [Clostridiales bacterium]